LTLDNDGTSAAGSDQPDDCSRAQARLARDLIRQCDVKGVLHTHTHGDDGAHSLSAMVATAHEIGLEYLGVSDHLLAGAEFQGLDEDGIERQRDEIEDLKDRYPGFDILQGVEVDADADGGLPLGEESLRKFDYVIVSLADGHHLDDSQQTRRAIRVVQNPLTSIMSKPVGDLMLRKPPVPLDMEAVLQAAADAGIAVEIDANPQCLDLNLNCCLRAQELGVYLAINPNAHRAARLVDYRHAVEMVRDAGICCNSILNTMTAEELRAFLAGSR